ncbi:unnamed protein product [Adineta ricciae]|uniref:PCNA-interacting partner n=1 Tax=Adineta ricciae TaxID=249248 RepID=A0A813SDL4_ADIRI|nr:unnamed protein product [Adineta ricciae]
MKIRLTLNNDKQKEDDLIDVSIDASSTISSWLIDYYFTKIYFNQVKSSNKSIQPNNIIGLHDMFIIYQIIQSPSTSTQFFDLCKAKLSDKNDEVVLESYNNYLKRCGLKDIIDLFHDCRLPSLIKQVTFNITNVSNELEQLFCDHLLELAIEHEVCNEQTESFSSDTKENIIKLFDDKKKHVEQTISKNYIKHTLCTYLSLLLDTRNEHALIHCLATPARIGIERRTVVELRRLTKLPKNECLTIYQILLSFLRRKELLLSRLSSSQTETTTNDDESFVILDKYFNGIKEFFDFIEQLQMIIEENEHLRIESIVTFRKLTTLISKQLRKDTSFSRCETIFKETIEEFVECFETTLKVTNCASPIRSASSGGTLAGRRFLRSVAYLCAKQTIHLPILLPNNDHYNSPSTGLRKATAFRLLQSPVTPVAVTVKQPVEILTEEKPIDTPVESVFMWKQKNEIQMEGNATSKRKKFQRRKSQRCLDLSSVEEQTLHTDSLTNHSTDSNEKTFSSGSSGSARQPLGEIDVSSLISEERQAADSETNEKSQSQKSLPLVSNDDQENQSINKNKRTIASTNVDEPRKKAKKTNAKPLIVGQKMITNFFRSKA